VVNPALIKLLLGIIVVVLAFVAEVGFALGLGRASFFAGMIGLFLGMAAFGGTLRTDLTILATIALVLMMFAPLLRLSCPRSGGFR
jgi:uncharacterized membrane protein